MLMKFSVGSMRVARRSAASSAIASPMLLVARGKNFECDSHVCVCVGVELCVVVVVPCELSSLNSEIAEADGPGFGRAPPSK